MLEIFIISTIFTTITAIILAISLRKYQISIYKKEAEFCHSEDEYVQEIEQNKISLNNMKCNHHN